MEEVFIFYLRSRILIFLVQILLLNITLLVIDDEINCGEIKNNDNGEKVLILQLFY